MWSCNVKMQLCEIHGTEQRRSVECGLVMSICVTKPVIESVSTLHATESSLILSHRALLGWIPTLVGAGAKFNDQVPPANQMRRLQLQTSQEEKLGRSTRKRKRRKRRKRRKSRLRRSKLRLRHLIGWRLDHRLPNLANKCTSCQSFRPTLGLHRRSRLKRQADFNS